VSAFLNFSRKNLLSVLLTVFLFVSLTIISFSAGKVREPVSKAAMVTKTISITANATDGFLEYYYGHYPPDYHYCLAYINDNMVGVGQRYINVTTNNDAIAMRSYFTFNTNGVIPSNASITSVSLRLGMYSNSLGAGVVTLQIRNFDWGNSLACPPAGSTAGYDWGGNPPTAPVVGSLQFGSSPKSGSFDIPLTDFYAIKRSGLTSFMLVDDREAANIEPAWYYESFDFYSSEYSVASARPQLIITYTVPVNPSQPPQPSQPSSPTPKNTSSSSSSGSNWGSSSNKNLPNTLKKINLKVSVPFLLGEVKVNIGIDQYSKELTLKHDETDYSIDTTDLGLPLNKIYTLTFSGDKILKKKIQFNASSAETNVNAMELTLGDLNADSAINNQDQLMFLDSISKQTSIGDINSDGATNSLDWSILLYNLSKVGD
jgi:hypothetical protein